MYKKIMHNLKAMDKNKVLVGIALVAVVVTGVLISNKPLANKVLSYLRLNSAGSNEQVAKKSVEYLNNNVLQDGQIATIEGISEESGLIKIKLKIGTNTYDSYATKDGKLLFPEAFVINPSAPGTGGTAQNPPAGATGVTPETVAKVANSSLEAYVVSSCPFGLQMQRAMAEAIKSAPELEKSVKVRYIGTVAADGKTTVAMHGPEEAAEDLRQICIREEQPTKYWAYVGCYMQKTGGTSPGGMPYGDTKNCQTVAKVDSAKLNSCVTDTSRGIKYAQEDFALNTKYGVQGSPTLILNGAEVSETPFGGRSAKGVAQMICSSSTNPPSFCKDVNFSTDSASTSFSLSYAAPGGTGATANCAPSV